MKGDIIRLLAHAPGYISGEALSEKLSVSRAAVWKHIAALREDGAVIEAHTNKGYRLLSLPDLLKPDYINAYAKQPIDQIRWVQSVDSTNDEGKRWAQQGGPDGAVVVAEFQTKGKGRLGRHWESVSGESVEMSFIFRPDIPPVRAPAVNFTAALGVCAAIEDVCGIKAGIKWPNDVVYDGKKLCGILTEMSSDMDHIEYLVCGMGVNTNQTLFPEEIMHKAASLRMLTGKPISRAQLCAAEIEYVNAYYRRYIEGGMKAIIGEYTEKSSVVGKEITVISGNETYRGICRGFADDGAILVEAQGEVKHLNAGEVSIRGEHGYI